MHSESANSSTVRHNQFRILLLVFAALILLVVVGFIILIGLSPSPFPIEKGNIKDSDYQIMVRVFSHDLPDSFRIRKKMIVGPWLDGPGYSNYDCIVKKADFAAMTNESVGNLGFSNLCYRYKDAYYNGDTLFDDQIKSKIPFEIEAISMGRKSGSLNATIQVKSITSKDVILMIHPGNPPEKWLD